MAAERPLSFYAYGLGESRGWELPATHSGVLDALAACGLPVCEHRATVQGAAGLIAFHARMREARDATLKAPQLILPALQVNIRAGELPPAEPSGRRYLKIPLTLT